MVFFFSPPNENFPLFHESEFLDTNSVDPIFYLTLTVVLAELRHSDLVYFWVKLLKAV